MYVIIRGPLGIGKTTIAKELAKKLKAQYISIDKILKKHKLDVIDKKQGCITLKNFIKGNNLILKKIKKKAVIDGCFYHLKQIQNLKKHLKPLYIVTLTATLKTCIKRDKNRKKSYGEEATKAVYKLVSNYGKIINTENKTKNQITKEILKKIFQKS